MTTGIVIFAHGSRVEAANQAVRRAAAALAEAGGYRHVQAAFLELGEPSLEQAVVRLIQGGVREVVVIPYFVALGTHLERDLPRLVRDLCAAHPGVGIRVTPPLDGHPAVTQILLDRARGKPDG